MATKTKKRPVKKKTTVSRKGPPMDVYSRERARHQSKSNRNRFESMKEVGKMKVRVVTFMHEKEEHAFVPNFTHFNVPGDKKAVQCPDSGCPICELEGQVPEETWKGGAKGRGGIKPSRRFVVNYIVRKGPNQSEDEHKVYEIPLSVWDGINKAIEEGEIAKAFDPRKGVDFLITRKNDKGFTKYTVSVIPQSKPVKIDFTTTDLIEAVGDPLELKALTKIADAIYETVS